MVTDDQDDRHKRNKEVYHAPDKMDTKRTES